MLWLISYKILKKYPRAIFLLVILAIILDIFGELTVAVTVPQSGLSLNVRVIQSFDYLLNNLVPSLTWIARIIVVFIILGVLEEIASWVILLFYYFTRLKLPSTRL